MSDGLATLRGWLVPRTLLAQAAVIMLVGLGPMQLAVGWTLYGGVTNAAWLLVLVLVQLCLACVCTWLAVRLATRPLDLLARAAESIGRDMSVPRLEVHGAIEAVRAAAAFNTMHERMSGYVNERLEVLAAIAHDLQTPITRARLRIDLMGEGPHTDTLRHDLIQMEQLAHEGVAYARALHAVAEQPQLMDADAFLESLVFDYGDAGHLVSLRGQVGRPVRLRPEALRRVLANLLDNALKFSRQVELAVNWEPDHRLCIEVLDRGPGIPIDQLDLVLKPFHRIRGPDHEGRSGSGLGLAIAERLSAAMGANLTLRNRIGGGLVAKVCRVPVSS